jgi:hypothetical protein
VACKFRRLAGVSHRRLQGGCIQGPRQRSAKPTDEASSSSQLPPPDSVLHGTRFATPKSPGYDLPTYYPLRSSCWCAQTVSTGRHGLMLGRAHYHLCVECLNVHWDGQLCTHSYICMPGVSPTGGQNCVLRGRHCFHMHASHMHVCDDPRTILAVYICMRKAVYICMRKGADQSLRQS